MIHSRTPSHPALIQPLPTGAAPPPTATRLHGAGSPRERLEATTPQRSTPTVSPYWTVLGGQVVIRAQPTSTGLLQTTAAQADRRRQQHQKKERGNLARPPQESKQSRAGSVHVLAPQDTPSWTVIRGQDAPRAQPPDDRIQPERGHQATTLHIYESIGPERATNLLNLTDLTGPILSYIFTEKPAHRKKARGGRRTGPQGIYPMNTRSVQELENH